VDEHGIDAARGAWRGEADGLHRAGCLGPPVRLPPGCTAVDSQMLLIVKVDGRFKGRLVARGDQQVDGDSFDSTTTHAPVLHQVSFRILMAIASALHAHVHTIDVNLAFRYAKNDIDIYIRPPRGTSWGRDDSGKPLVRRAIKALYGLRASASLWLKAAWDALEAFGLEAAQSDPCVLTMKRDGVMLYVGLYVDDFVIISLDLDLIAKLKAHLADYFEYKDPGRPHREAQGPPSGLFRV